MPKWTELRKVMGVTIPLLVLFLLFITFVGEPKNHILVGAESKVTVGRNYSHGFERGGYSYRIYPEPKKINGKEWFSPSDDSLKKRDGFFEMVYGGGTSQVGLFRKYGGNPELMFHDVDAIFLVPNDQSFAGHEVTIRVDDYTVSDYGSHPKNMILKLTIQTVEQLEKEKAHRKMLLIIYGILLIPSLIFGNKLLSDI